MLRTRFITCPLDATDKNGDTVVIPAGVHVETLSQTEVLYLGQRLGVEPDDLTKQGPKDLYRRINGIFS